LPFVFALLCTPHHTDELRRLRRAFVSKKVKIPYYILMEASRKSNLSPTQVTDYLKFISYKVGVKEEKGYKRFVGEAKKRGLNPPLSKIRY
jgi:chorismate dehydratase